MLVLRLTRTGKAHEPHYRIVVQEKRSKLTGKAVDQIGHYHPATTKELVIDAEKAKLWLSRGAQASDTVTNLLVRAGVLGADKKVHNFFTPTKPEVVEEAPTEEVAVEEAETAEETPATEEVAEEVATEEAAVEDAAPEEAPVAEATEEVATPAEEPTEEAA